MSRRKLKKQNTSSVVAEQWPAGLPLTRENITKMQQDYTVYVQESGYALPILEDPDQDQWTETGVVSTSNPSRYRTRIRELARNSATGKRILDLYRYYVLGGQPEAVLVPEDPEEPANNQVIKRANKRLRKEMKRLALHLSMGEMNTRAYRDGDLFIRRIAKPEEVGGYDYRFIDPEDVMDEDGNEMGGIVTDPSDVVSVIEYTLSRQTYNAAGVADGYKTYATVPVEDMVHLKIDCDSTEKRGRTRLMTALDPTTKHRDMLINEVTLRQSQSAIVMVRKVSGGSGAARSIMDAAKTTTSAANEHYSGQEKYRPGTVATTTKGVEISFAHPDNNFSDAGPLLQVLMREDAKATGFSYEQISCDTSSGSLASALVAESPVLQMVNEERAFWNTNLQKFFQWLLEGQGINWDDYEVKILFPNIETKDITKIAQSANLGYMAKAISSKEMSRRLGADPETMRQEILEEAKIPEIVNALTVMNPGAGDKATSSAGNAGAGGTNQGSQPSAGNVDPGKQGIENS